MDQKIIKLKDEIEAKYDAVIKETAQQFQLQLSMIETKNKAAVKKELEQSMEIRISKIEAAFKSKHDDMVRKFEKTVDDKVATLMGVIKTKDEEIGKINREIGELKASLNYLSKDTENLSDKIVETKVETDKIHKDMYNVYTKTSDLEDRSKRNNLIFYNIEESPQENCDKKVDTLLQAQQMLHEGDNELAVDRAHRLGKREDGRTRPLIIRCTYYKDKEWIINNKYKLRDSGVTVSEDYSRQTAAIQKELYQKGKAAKNAYSLITKFHVNYKYVSLVYEVGHGTDKKLFRKHFNLSDINKSADWYKLRD